MTSKTDEGGAGGQPEATIVYAENLFATEVYSDDASYFALKGGNVSITFTSIVWDNTAGRNGQVTRTVVGRLVIPTAGAQGLAYGLYDFLAQRGLAPDMKSPGGGPAN